MVVYNYILISIAVFSLTISLYYILQVIFIYKSILNKYLLFSFGTFFAAFYILFQLLFINADDQYLVLFAKLKLLSIGLAAPFWITFIYRFFFVDKLLIRFLWVILILPLTTIFTGYYFTNIIIKNKFWFFYEIIQIRFVQGNVLYYLHSIIILILVFFIILKIIFNKFKINKKIIAIIALSPFIGGINDFLITLLKFNGFLITEYFFFIAVFSVFIFFFREERINYLKISNMNIILEKEVALRTEELKQTNEKLKKLDVLKNDFIANITHDFRSPLTVILNLTDLSIKNGKAMDKEELEIIIKSTLKLKSSIDRLLDLAKMDEKGIKINIRKTNINAFLESIIDYYISALMNSKIKFIKKIPYETIDNFYIDTEKLEEIINNIISNSLKFISIDNGLIEIELKNHDKYILIIIKDNGIGIPKDKLSVIFNRFEQLNKGRNSSYGGTGIGLSYSKQLIELMKGEIWAESEGNGKGASFFIKLLKGKDHFNMKDITFIENGTSDNGKNNRNFINYDIQRKLEEDKLDICLDDLNSKNENDYKKAIILIIDDDANIARIIMEYLKLNKFKNFIISNNGKMGLQAVYQYNPDIIICDYYMPDIKGDVIHDELLANSKYKDKPFIFLSAVGDKKIIYERREKGAFAYLKKPIDEKDLILTIEFHLKKYFEQKQGKE